MLGSIRLVVDWFIINLFRAPVLCMPILFGDGSAGCFLSKSLSLEMPMLFGFENSFIFDFSLTGFCCSSGGAGEP